LFQLPISLFHESGLSEHFCESVFIDRLTGSPIELPPHQKQWHSFIRDSEKNLKLILAPRSHGKSVNILGILLYYLYINPNHTIKIISATEPIAQARLETLKAIIDSNENFKILTGGKIQPDTKRGWSNEGLYIKRPSNLIDPSIQAFGVMQNLTGSRASILMLDDIINDTNSMNEDARNKLLIHLETVIYPILEPDGLVITIGTVYHLHDYYEHIMNSPAWSILIQSISENLSCIQQVTW